MNATFVSASCLPLFSLPLVACWRFCRVAKRFLGMRNRSLLFAAWVVLLLLRPAVAEDTRLISKALSVIGMLKEWEESYSWMERMHRCRLWLATPEGKAQIALLVENYDLLPPLYRRQLAEQFAGSESIEAVPLLKKALSDEQGIAMSTIGELVIPHDGQGRPEAWFSQPIAPLLVPWLDHQSPQDSQRELMTRRIIELLPIVDADLATKTLGTREFLSPQSPWAGFTYAQFNRWGIKLPLEQIENTMSYSLGVMNASKAGKLESGSYVAALEALALHRPREAMERVYAFQMCYPGESGQMTGVVLAAHGLADFFRLNFNALGDPIVYQKLPDEARRFISALCLLTIANAGIEQVYTTDTYDYQWEDGIRGLEEINMPSTYIAFLRKTEKVFGPQGPTKNYQKRQEAISAMNPSLNEQIDGLYDEWANSNDSRDEISPRNRVPEDYLLVLYAAEHAEVMRSCVPLLRSIRFP